MDDVAVTHMTADCCDLVHFRSPLVEDATVMGAGHIHAVPIAVDAGCRCVRTQDILIRYGEVIISNHRAFEFTGHREIVIREILMAQHMLAHLEDGAAPCGSRRRSHDDTRRIEIAASLLTEVVIEVRCEHSLFTIRPLCIIGDDTGEDAITVGVAMPPHFGITEVHRRRSDLSLLAVLTDGIHDDAFVGLCCLLIGDERTESRLHIHGVAGIVIDSCGTNTELVYLPAIEIKDGIYLIVTCA